MAEGVWLKESIFWEEWKDEAEFLFVRAVEKKEGAKIARESGGRKGKGREVEIEKHEEEGDGRDQDER